MNVHFVAIGGAAMHNMAIAMKIGGHTVTGSDDEIFDPSKSRLESYGLLPKEKGWFPEKINNSLDAIILGMHARPDNLELKRAVDIGIPVYSFPEFLYQHAKAKQRIAIGGSHGKTTITAMIMHVLKDTGHDFDYLVGSKIRDFDVMVRMSDDSELMIFEGDEYLSSPIDLRPKFHWYKPDIALLSGIAWDHINVFPTFDNYVEQFSVFIDLIEPDGVLIYNEKDSVLNELVKTKTNIKVLPYKGLDFVVNEGKNFVLYNGEEIEMKVFGTHNMMNMDGARIVCNQLGIGDDVFFESIRKFEGTDNRLELIAESNDSKVYKDFAHAPSKVKATVQAVKQQFPDRNLVACLELHTFSSLNKNFIGQYKGALDMADSACVYFNDHTIKLKKLPELSVDDVKVSFAREDVFVTTSSDEINSWLVAVKKNNSVYLFMSSGSFKGLNLKEVSGFLLDQ